MCKGPEAEGACHGRIPNRGDRLEKEADARLGRPDCSWMIPTLILRTMKSH